MKYVSVRCRSVATVAFGGPVRPPSRNTTMPARVKSMGTGKTILPRHSVPNQEKNFTPVGTATSRVLYMNGTRRHSATPDANIWCPQTRNPISAMANEEMATHLYPYKGLRANTGNSSLMIPKPGKTKTYTAG